MINKVPLNEFIFRKIQAGDLYKDPTASALVRHITHAQVNKAAGDNRLGFDRDADVVCMIDDNGKPLVTTGTVFTGARLLDCRLIVPFLDLLATFPRSRIRITNPQREGGRFTPVFFEGTLGHHPGYLGPNELFIMGSRLDQLRAAKRPLHALEQGFVDLFPRVTK